MLLIVVLCEFPSHKGLSFLAWPRSIWRRQVWVPNTLSSLTNIHRAASYPQTSQTAASERWGSIGLRICRLWTQSQWVQSSFLGVKSLFQDLGASQKLFLKRRIVIFRRQHKFTPKFRSSALLFIYKDLLKTLYCLCIYYRHSTTLDYTGLYGLCGVAAWTGRTLELSHSFPLLCFLLKTVSIKRLIFSKRMNQSIIPKQCIDCLKIQKGILGITPFS